MTQFNLGKTSTGRPFSIAARYAARHGLIAGATGTGKSYTIARLVEQMTAAQIPVFLVDVKGDLAGLARSTPCRFYDPAGQTGARFAIRCDDLGADSMARALQLTDAQSGALDIAFAFARDRGRSVGTLADLQNVMATLEQSKAGAMRRYGHFTQASLAVVRRAIVRLDASPCPLFGDSSFDVSRLQQAGTATILDATRLAQSPTLYGAAMLYLLDSLYQSLPETGDTGAPRLVLFLDEAHLIFGELSPAVMQRIERIVRLIRSKGVAIWFASQSPGDIPPAILAQLGTRIQHGLRGATTADLRAIRAAAETMPINPAIDAATAIVKLGVGQALASTIGDDGVPTPVEIVQVAAPRATLSPIDPATRATMRGEAPGAPAEKRTGTISPLMTALFFGLLWGLPLAFVIWAIWHGPVYF